MTVPVGNGTVAISLIDPERMALNDCNSVTDINECDGLTKTQQCNGVTYVNECNGITKTNQCTGVSNGVIDNGVIRSNGIIKKDDEV
jgi:hypothetical protein